ncbi:hypothetical protein BCR41DRAFT_354971 [Lobosporangium transversale]|uniref:Uncharacterized protein n=1 Tax=Lobosporangium transversale TaxID=64571 RepID=A0A1Y2GKD8_9FUNG|nr:hypothetical protein BCR41DRAFT_354971 [Lobosporangium transversale]ORZ13776.1 hypothetical protein BCR41DRAFT_354971 [Lobosporangium transversale]|eukprot:XP_021880560.1 hypothetical protein BCR41DRAFT_354971 [Lobosporangium transversale]
MVSSVAVNSHFRRSKPKRRFTLNTTFHQEAPLTIEQRKCEFLMDQITVLQRGYDKLRQEKATVELQLEMMQRQHQFLQHQLILHQKRNKDLTFPTATKGLLLPPVIQPSTEKQGVLIELNDSSDDNSNGGDDTGTAVAVAALTPTTAAITTTLANEKQNRVEEEKNEKTRIQAHVIRPNPELTRDERFGNSLQQQQQQQQASNQVENHKAAINTKYTHPIHTNAYTQAHTQAHSNYPPICGSEKWDIQHCSCCMGVLIDI